ncbi:MAG: LysM peptidoglycan-binding domain-containing protein [Prevotellaceae bacterium]|jgi:LysM repeat protein/ABC-type branched-subunit amino acid transport system substrate-binding protein|nr:LysM peptidoglycan-binding domain-containing protein [Prevotellaceae bacterium]
MKFRLNILFVTVIFLLHSENILSQISQDRYKAATLFYYIHTIQKGETLGQIASNYRVLVSEILEVNRHISDIEKIKAGQKIVVPDYSRFIDKYPHDRWSFVLYKVKQGDKLKSLAKEFKTDVDDIKAINPGIDNKPGFNSEIRIPVPKQGIAQLETTEKQEKKDKNKEKEREKQEKEKEKQENKSSRVNSVLTFDWGGDNKTTPQTGQSTNESEEGRYSNCREYVYKSGTVFNISIVVSIKKENGTNDLNGIAFLQGALLAVEEMKNNGLSINLCVFDVGKDVNKALKSPQLIKSDIIIAPLSLTHLNKLAPFAMENRIKLVIPHESKAQSLIAGNPYVIQVYPSDETIYKKLTSKQYDNNITPILIKPEKCDSVMLENYRSALKARFGKFKEHTHVMGLELNRSHFKNVLDENRQNIVFVCSNIEPFVSDLLVRLDLSKSQIIVYGRERWRDFRSIKWSLYYDLNLHLAQPFFVDYKDERVKQFVRSYRGAYNDEPEGYAFHGYDVLYYFAAALKKYGTSFTECFTEFNSTLLQSQYKFKQNNINDGFINDGCFLLEYSTDIEIKKE